MKYLTQLILLCSAFLFSCADKHKTLPIALAQAESVMWEYPDSALYILRSMPCPSSDQEAYATWCLLMAQARDKVYGHRLPDSLNIPTSEELVQNTMNYFETSKDLKRKGQAYYYRGQLLRDRKEYTKAIMRFLEAKDIMIRLDEPLFTYLICQSLGNTYRYQNMFDESLVQLNDAYKFALKSQNGKRVSYALSELGRTYMHLACMDSALFYFDQSLKNAQEIGDIELQGMAMGELGVVYGELRKYDKALFYTKQELDLYTRSGAICDLPQVKYSLGCAFWQSNQLDSAKIYLNEALQADNIYTLEAAYYALYSICVEKELYKDAIEYNEQFLIYSDSIQKITYTRELSEIQAKYDHEKLMNKYYQLQVDNSRLGIIGLVMILILLCIVVLYQFRLVKRTKSLQEAREVISFCKERIEVNEEQIRENEEQIASLNQNAENMDTLRAKNNELCKQNELLNGKIENNIQILRSQHTTLSDLLPYFNKLKRLNSHPRYLKEKDWIIITEWLNLQYNNFIIRLETDIPDLTEVDKQYCSLIKMGFSNPEIGLFMNVSPSSVTKQKQRIKQRIKKNNPVLANHDFSLDQYLKDF